MFFLQPYAEFTSNNFLKGASAMNRVFLIVLFATCLGLGGICMAQDNMLANIRDIHKRDVKFEGFTLNESQSISIVVAGSDKERPLWTRAWILNSDTREVVWNIRHASQKDDEGSSVQFTDKIVLPKGTYEVYYASFPYNFYNIDGFSGFMDFLGDKVFRWNDKDDDFADNAKGLSIVVSGNGTHLTHEAVEKHQEEYKKSSVFSMSGLGDNQSEHQGFILTKPTQFTVYAIGEARSDGSYDYGWIKNVKTGEIVWTMMNKDLKHAGGDKKNRMVNETISLPAGTYAAFFVTDDSHSSREWNAPPPYDPQFWGITVRVNDSAAKQNVRLYEYENVPAKNVIVELIRMRDKEMRSKGFTLKRGMDIRVLAIGEGRDHEMSDYGWITDAKTNKKVWEMKYMDTEHAGGAEKNRMVDKVIHLDGGSYMVYFVTDGSHSYHDWNSTPPFDQEHWGITLVGIEENYNASDVAPLDDQNDKSILARIVGVRDDERRRKSFTLDKDTEVCIYAIGEGRDHKMYDYGWIEDAKSGKTVWEMTYHMTEHAGGAEKNRQFNGTVVLKAGEYVLRYKSDDSHSFEDWNEDPPSDPFNWGITVYDASTKISEK